MPCLIYCIFVSTLSTFTSKIFHYTLNSVSANSWHLHWFIFSPFDHSILYQETHAHDDRKFYRYILDACAYSVANLRKLTFVKTMALEVVRCHSSSCNQKFKVTIW